jgi:signal transduction histidine kinase
MHTPTVNIAIPPHSDEPPTELVQQLRRAQDDMHHFVRALSHDLGANLMLMDSSLRRLNRSLRSAGPATAEVAADLAHIEACVLQSRRLLDDMVELGRTGSVRVEPGPVDLAKIVDEVLFEQRELLAERGVAVTVEQPLPVLWCNQDRLKQIVVNLVRNAARHGGDPARPRITIAPLHARAKAPAARGLAGFSVHDNGPGIDPRFHEEIFLPGRRLPQAASDGSGMGLAIVRRAVELYGGEVYLDQDCPQGTTFSVWLPAAKPLAAGLKAPGDPREPERLPASAARHPDHSPKPHNRFTGKLKRHGRP